MYKLSDSCSISNGAQVCSWFGSIFTLLCLEILLSVKKQLLNLAKQLMFSTEKHTYMRVTF